MQRQRQAPPAPAPIAPTPSEYDPLAPPSDTHNRPERNSRIVIRDSKATLWNMMIEGEVRESHLNARFVPLCIASPTREGSNDAAPPLLPFQRQTLPPQPPAPARAPAPAPAPDPPAPPPPPLPPRTSPPRARPALGDIDVNVLRNELRRVEHDCAVLKAQNRRQEAALASLCAWIADR